MYRTAIIGAGGGRAAGHAEAYGQISGARLVAASSRDRTRLEAFADRFGISERYTDYREMLAREKPDLVHVNTPPDVRLEVFEAAAAESVPALIVEKPLAIEAEDHAAMQAFASTTKIKIAVNHQLHFHPRRAWLQQRVGSGAIGEIRFVDASAGMNLAYQGTHSLEAIAYEDGARAQLQCGPGAPQVGREGIHTHKRIAVYGTRGFAHWWMWGWELGVDGRVETGSHEYPEEDVLGQARMTEAMFRWLEEDAAVHPLHLERSLEDFGVILGIYTSALRSEIVELPVTARPGLIAALRGRLDEA